MMSVLNAAIIINLVTLEFLMTLFCKWFHDYIPLHPIRLSDCSGRIDRISDTAAKLRRASSKSKKNVDPSYIIPLALNSFFTEAS